MAITDTVPAERGRLNVATWASPLFVLLWSTGFIGAKFGLPYAEPFTLLLMRFGIASLLLIGLALALRAPWPRTPIAVFHIVVAGLLLHAVYIGGVFVAISLGMPAGVTSLIVGLQPVLTAIFAPALLKERIIARQWMGLLLGLAGVGLVVGEKLVTTSGAVHAITTAGMLVGVANTRAHSVSQARNSSTRMVQYLSNEQT